MNFRAIVLTALLPATLFASELPKKKNLKILKVGHIGQGTTVKLNTYIDLPDGQKLNTGAPNQITIYEKGSQGWQPVKKIAVNGQQVIPGMDLNFQNEVQLKDPSSELAIDATLYHCSIKKGPCYIDDFQIQIKRQPEAPQQATAQFFPTKKF